MRSLSPNVYITDCDHEYRDVDVPVIDQGIVQRGQKVSIGEGSYIGINVFYEVDIRKQLEICFGTGHYI